MTRLSRFATWRRTSTAWTYGVLMAGWLGLTAAGILALSSFGPLVAISPPVFVVTSPWRLVAAAVLGSASLFLLLFEVGIAYLIAAAYSSHQALASETAARIWPEVKREMELHAKSYEEARQEVLRRLDREGPRAGSPLS